MPGLLITGGYLGYDEGSSTSVEVFRVSTGQWCALPSLPDHRRDHTSHALTVCGGYENWYEHTETNCISFSSGKWNISHTLVEERVLHLSWEREEGQILLLGGSYNPTTTELLTVESDQGEPGFSLEKETW